MTLEDLSEARDWLVLLGRKAARERLASFLVRLVPHRAPGSSLKAPFTVALPLSREDMADHLGFTIKTVSRQIAAMYRAGFLSCPSRRSVVIYDLPALLAATGDDGGLPD
jgi:CRP/FNR family transcriptional regulator, anaerobic regulatory protein